MEDSIFTKIIKGEIPCHKVFEDDKALAFMDIHPIQPGHILVVPKAQVDCVWNLSPEDYRGLMAAVQKVGQKLRQVMPEKRRVGVIIEGLEAEDHAHVKVFPFDTDTEFRNVPDQSADPDHVALAELAKKLRIPDNT